MILHSNCIEPWGQTNILSGTVFHWSDINVDVGTKLEMSPIVRLAPAQLRILGSAKDNLKMGWPILRWAREGWLILRWSMTG